MEETKIDRIDLDSRPVRGGAKEEAASPPEETGTLMGRNIKILILFMGVIFLIGSVLAVTFFLGWISLPGLSSGKKREATPPPAAIGPMLKISPLLINLKEEGGRHYIKTTIVLEIGRPEWLEEVRSRVPLVTDLAILALSEKRLRELHQAEAKESLKKELLTKINQALGTPKVAQIYFDEFLLQ